MVQGLVSPSLQACKLQVSRTLNTNRLGLWLFAPSTFTAFRASVCILCAAPISSPEGSSTLQFPNSSSWSAEPSSRFAVEGPSSTTYITYSGSRESTGQEQPPQTPKHQHPQAPQPQHHQARPVRLPIACLRTGNAGEVTCRCCLGQLWPRSFSMASGLSKSPGGGLGGCIRVRPLPHDEAASTPSAQPRPPCDAPRGILGAPSQEAGEHISFPRSGSAVTTNAAPAAQGFETTGRAPKQEELPKVCRTRLLSQAPTRVGCDQV